MAQIESEEKTITGAFRAANQATAGRVFLKNTALSIAGNGLNVLVLGVYFIILARALGPKEYGAFAAVLALSRIFSFFSSWGYGNILIKNVSRDPGVFRAYWGICIQIVALGGLSLTFIVLGIATLALHLDIPVNAVIFIAITDLMFSGIVALSQQAYLAFDNMYRYTQLQAGSSAFRLAGAVFMIAAIPEPGVMSWSLLYCFTGLVPALVSIALVNHELGCWTFEGRIVRAEVLEGFYFSVSQSSQTIYNDIDKTLLASMASVAATGLYTAAYRFVDFSFTPINGLLSASYANFFRHGDKGVQGGLEWARKIIGWACGYGLLSAAALFTLAGLLPLVLGSMYSETVVILRWLSPVMIFKSVELFIANILTGSGHQGVRTAIQLSLAAVNFGVTVWFINLYGWLGAALASIGTEILAVAAFTIAVLVLLEKQEHDKSA